MTKEAIFAEGAPAAIGPYCHAVKVGNLVFLSGQLGLDPETGKLGGDIKEQTRQAIANIKTVLASVGCTLNNVVKTTVYLGEMHFFNAMNEVYASEFGKPYPARSAFSVKELPKQALVEIEVIAAL